MRVAVDHQHIFDRNAELKLEFNRAPSCRQVTVSQGMGTFTCVLIVTFSVYKLPTLLFIHLFCFVQRIKVQFDNENW